MKFMMIILILSCTQFVYSKELRCRNVNLENKTYVYCPETAGLYLLQPPSKNLDQLKKRIGKLKENNVMLQDDSSQNSHSSSVNSK